MKQTLMLKGFIVICLMLILPSLVLAEYSAEIKAYWPFNETAGNTAVDMLGRNNLTGSPAWVAGYSGNAFYANATNHMYNATVMTNDVNISVAGGTLSAWILFNDTNATSRRIVTARDAAKNVAFEFIQSSGGTVQFNIYNETATSLSASYSLANFANYGWYHLTGTWNSTSLVLWMNTSAVVNISTVAANIQKMREIRSISVGADFDGALKFFGIVDDLILANRSSNAIQIETYMKISVPSANFKEWGHSFMNNVNETETRTLNYSFLYDSSVFSSYTASLIYNDTPSWATYSVSSSGLPSNITLTRTLDTPLMSDSSATARNIYFYYQILFANSTGTFAYNSSLVYRQVNLLRGSICNATTPTIFLNVSFRDEASNNPMNATISDFFWTYYLGSGVVNRTFTYSNSSGFYSYPFCFNLNTTINSNFSFTYASTGYPQRTYFANVPYTKTVTNKVLYLLSSSDGVYSNFQVSNQADQALSSVTVTVERQISGVWTVLNTGSTGDDGVVSFWVNPNYQHRFTFEKEGYTTDTQSITPIATTYYVTLSSTGTATGSTDLTKGISVTTIPSDSVLNNQTYYVFWLNLSSSIWTLDSWGFILKNASGTSLGSNSSVANGGSLSLNATTGDYQGIVMDYYWVIDSNYSNATRYWAVAVAINDTYSLKNFFRDLVTYTDAGMFGLNEFSRTILIFLFIFIIVGVMCYVSGVYSVGAVLLEIAVLVTLFDAGLSMIPNPVNAVPYFPTIICWFVLVLYAFMETR